MHQHYCIHVVVVKELTRFHITVVAQVYSRCTCGNYPSRWWPLNSTTNGCDWLTCMLPKSLS